MTTSTTENAPKRSGKIQCRIHQVDVVIGENGLMFCPIEECINSEANYS